MAFKWLPRARSRGITEARRAGDAAREQRDWTAAANAYRRHLDERPDDFAILIQLGHMLKEAGDLDGALSSYERARILRAEDADLMLSLGHLHKLRGDIAAALRAYETSLTLGHSNDARREFDTLVVEHPAIAAAHWPNVEQEDDRIAPYLATISTGVRAVASQSLELIDDHGQMAGLSTDPWIEFVPTIAMGDAKLAILEIAFDRDWDANSAPMMTRVYLDYGTGFDEGRVLSFDNNVREVRLLLAYPELITRIRWDPDTRPSQFAVRSVVLRPLADAARWPDEVAALGGTATDAIIIMKALSRITGRAATEELATTIQRRLPPSIAYENWIDTYVTPLDDDHARIAAMIADMKMRPRFSFVMPTYNTPVELLTECLDSMLAQSYPNFELCIADDNSSDPAVAEILTAYAERDARVKIILRKQNGHISAATNTALTLATGDFIVLVDHDDLIPDYTLATVAWYINKHPDASVLYSDEDKIDMNGVRHAPYFKGEFSKFLVYGHNMISHLGVYRRSLVEEIGGFRMGLEGSQDYDLFLRCYERIGDAGVAHIPHVLYHWRTVPGSTSLSPDQKGYAAVAAEAAINGYFERNAVQMRSIAGVVPGLTGVKDTSERTTPISIIIPTKDGLDVLKPCIASIFAANPVNIEVLILDNNSADPATLDYFAALQAEHSEVRVLHYPEPFNFSAINNFGATHATGDILCFLNNDTEVLAPGWLGRARMLLALPDVGLVGARLLFPDGHLQHFGIGLGMGAHGIAGTPAAGLPAEELGYFGKAKLLQDVSAATAACLFTRKRDFDAIGGFDTVFRVAYNDVDLCLRYRKAGWRIVVDPWIELLHRESRSRGSDKTGANVGRLEREADLMRERWGEVLSDDPFLSPNLSLDRSDFALAHPPRRPVPWRLGQQD